MKKVMFLAVALMFAFSTIDAQTTNSSPEITIKSFYKWYVAQISKNKFPLIDSPKKLKQFVTVRCFNENKNVYDKNEFDADYFIAAQDFDEKWGTNVKVSNVVIKSMKATADVTLDGKGKMDSKLKLKLIQQNGTWKIDVIDGQN